MNRAVYAYRSIHSYKLMQKVRSRPRFNCNFISIYVCIWVCMYAYAYVSPSNIVLHFILKWKLLLTPIQTQTAHTAHKCSGVGQVAALGYFMLLNHQAMISQLNVLRRFCCGFVSMVFGTGSWATAGRTKLRMLNFRNFTLFRLVGWCSKNAKLYVHRENLEFANLSEWFTYVYVGVC